MKLLLKALRTLAAVVSAFVLFVAAYAAYVNWDTGRVQALCDEAVPGTPVSALDGIASSHGLTLRASTRDSKGEGYTIFVPAPSTMGDTVCAIAHDGAKVSDAHMLEY